MSIGMGGRAGGGFRFADLFAGIGGFRLALEGLGGACVFSSEIDRHARATYHMNFNEWPWGDIRRIRAEAVPEHDILCGGFPCQPFSVAGKQMGFEDEIRGTLFFEILRILRAKKPAVAFLENVKNLAGHDGGRTMGVIQKALEHAGYSFSQRVLDASHYGAPTSRERVYIVCFRSDLGVADFRFPEPTFAPVKLTDVLVSEEKARPWVLRGHPVTIDEDAVAGMGGEVALRTVRVGRAGSRRQAGQGYRIYDCSGHAVTFCARGGGLGAKTGLYRINGDVRRLHPRECLRAMGYPDSFTIPPTVAPDQFRTLIGNSVAVPVIRLIAERILAALGGPQSMAPLSAPAAPVRPSGGAAAHAAT